MAPRTLKVLYVLHDQVETLDFTGPLEVLAHARYPSSSAGSPGTPVFSATVTAVSEFTSTNQKLTVKRDIPIEEAYSTLAEYDVLLVPGGGSGPVLEKKTEPIGLIAAFVALPKREDGNVRTLFSVCTGSLFLADAGALKGLSATTHQNYYDQLRELTTSEAGGSETTVLEERFVVNKVDEERGLRVITSGGVSCGLDASLWLIESLTGADEKKRVGENIVMYQYREGVVL